MNIETNQKGESILKEGEQQYATDSAVKVSVGGKNLLILTEVDEAQAEKSNKGEPNVDGENREPQVDNSAIENRETASQDNASPKMGKSYPTTERQF